MFYHGRLIAHRSPIMLSAPSVAATEDGNVDIAPGNSVVIVNKNLTSVNFNLEVIDKYFNNTRIENSVAQLGDRLDHHRSYDSVTHLVRSQSEIEIPTLSIVEAPNQRHNPTISSLNLRQILGDSLSVASHAHHDTPSVAQFVISGGGKSNEANVVGVIQSTAPGSTADGTEQGIMSPWSWETYEPPGDQCIIFKDNAKPKWKVQERTWYSRGRIFKVRDTSNRNINSRVMIALAATGHSSVICLALCNHDTDEDMHDSFWDTHAEVYMKAPSDPTTTTRPNGQSESATSLDSPRKQKLGLDLEDGAQLLEESFVNFEHPYTIKITEVEVARCAKVVRQDIEKMMDAHSRVYNEAIKRGFNLDGPKSAGPVSEPATKWQ
ncbi:hypothetical protein PG989_015669 [Apiospora arundinis]